MRSSTLAASFILSFGIAGCTATSPQSPLAANPPPVSQSVPVPENTAPYPSPPLFPMNVSPQVEADLKALAPGPGYNPACDEIEGATVAEILEKHREIMNNPACRPQPNAALHLN